MKSSSLLAVSVASAVIGVSALLLQACQKREDANPAPSSSATKAVVMQDAEKWMQRAPTLRSYCETLPSGSMLSLFGSNAILLLERSNGSDLTVGDIALYAQTMSDGTISHRVREVSPTAILCSGDNNDTSDGWIAKSRVRWRVAGILYSQR